MRILYVATTRARERLVLTASQKQKICSQIISSGFFFGAESIPDWQLCSCSSSLEWVLYALSEQKSLHSAFGTGLAEQALDDDLFSFKLYDQPQLKQLSKFVIKLKADKLTRSVPPVCHSERSAPPPCHSERSAPPICHSERSASGAKNLPKRAESKLLAQVKKSLAWQYRFGDAYILPAKTSVTQLTHRNDEYIKFDYSRALDRQPGALVSAEPALPEYVEPRLLGTAAHLVISQLDLARPVTEEAIEKTKDKLLTDNAISTCVVGQIDTEAILTFFHSDLGQMVFAPQNTIFREWPFTFALPASEWKDSYVLRNTQSCPELSRRDAIRDTIIMQGIIDMLIRTPKGLVIIDFKTDKVTAGEVHERAELYRRQLDLYSRAASAILGRRQASLKSESIAKWLYFLTPATEFELK